MGIKLINEFSGEAYTWEDKVVLVATMLDFPSCDPKAVEKFAESLELELAAGTDLYIAAQGLLEEFLDRGRSEEWIRETSRDIIEAMFI